MIVSGTIFRRKKKKKLLLFGLAFLENKNKIYSSSSSSSFKNEIYYSTDVTRHEHITKEPQLKNKNNRNQSDKDNLRHSRGERNRRGEKKKKHFHPLLHHHHQRRGISTTLAASRAPNNNSKLWPTNSCVGTCSTENLLLLLQRHVFLMKVQLFLPLFPLERENKSLTSP